MSDNLTICTIRYMLFSASDSTSPYIRVYHLSHHDTISIPLILCFLQATYFSRQYLQQHPGNQKHHCSHITSTPNY